jgi:predicted nucleic acid-binding protein
VAVVADASLLVALATRDPRSERVSAWFLYWLDQVTDIHAPELALYEVASGITRLVAAGALPTDRMDEVCQHVGDLPMSFHPLSRGRASSSWPCRSAEPAPTTRRTWRSRKSCARRYGLSTAASRATPRSTALWSA